MLEGIEFKQAHESEWRAEDFHLLKDRLEYVKDEEERTMVAELLKKHEEEVVPHQHKLTSDPQQYQRSQYACHWLESHWHN